MFLLIPDTIETCVPNFIIYRLGCESTLKWIKKASPQPSPKGEGARFQTFFCFLIIEEAHINSSFANDQDLGLRR
ncbi:MAG: hypothetical protein ABI123_10235 [Ginsengibacter sp.]